MPPPPAVPPPPPPKPPPPPPPLHHLRRSRRCRRRRPRTRSPPGRPARGVRHPERAVAGAVSSPNEGTGESRPFGVMPPPRAGPYRRSSDVEPPLPRPPEHPGQPLGVAAAGGPPRRRARRGGRALPGSAGVALGLGVLGGHRADGADHDRRVGRRPDRLRRHGQRARGPDGHRHLLSPVHEALVPRPRPPGRARGQRRHGHVRLLAAAPHRGEPGARPRGHVRRIPPRRRAGALPGLLRPGAPPHAPGEGRRARRPGRAQDGGEGGRGSPGVRGRRGRGARRLAAGPGGPQPSPRRDPGHRPAGGRAVGREGRVRRGPRARRGRLRVVRRDPLRGPRAGGGPRARRAAAAGHGGARRRAHPRAGPGLRAEDPRQHRDPGPVARGQRPDHGRPGARPPRGRPRGHRPHAGARRELGVPRRRRERFGW